LLGKEGVEKVVGGGKSWRQQAAGLDGHGWRAAADGFPAKIISQCD
jgi:hypothetical protein